MKKKANTKNPKFLVTKFVDYKKLSKGDWAREVKIAKKLLEKDPDIYFKIKLDFNLNSLAWFLSEDGKLFVYKYLSDLRLNLPSPEIVSLSDKVFGESMNLAKKPQTIKDFIKKYGKTT